jgi:hypothetical protein
VYPERRIEFLRHNDSPTTVDKDGKRRTVVRSRAIRRAMSLPAPIQRLAASLAQSWKERAIVLKAISFAMVGVVNTIIDASVFFLVYALLTTWPRPTEAVTALAGV